MRFLIVFSNVKRLPRTLDDPTLICSRIYSCHHACVKKVVHALQLDGTHLASHSIRNRTDLAIGTTFPPALLMYNGIEREDLYMNQPLKERDVFELECIVGEVEKEQRIKQDRDAELGEPEKERFQPGGLHAQEIDLLKIDKPVSVRNVQVHVVVERDVERFVNRHVFLDFRMLGQRHARVRLKERGP